MTTTEFSAWLEARGLSDQAAAPLLAASRIEVWRWRTGERTVPRRIARIVELLQTLLGARWSTQVAPGSLARALDTRAATERGPNFMGRPARWYDEGPRWRCANNHVSRRYLKSEERGALCLACLEPLHLTFPEDTDGPLASLPTQCAS